MEYVGINEVKEISKYILKIPSLKKLSFWIESIKDDDLLKINENICFPNVISINASNKDSESK